MRPNAEMSSGQATFDLKAARQMCAELPGRDKLPLPDRIDREERVLRLFPAALDEIERQAAQIENSTVMRDALQARTANQAKRIAELEVDNQRWREYNQQLYKATRKQHAALKKLGNAKRARGKALVEERAKRLVADRGDCPYRSPIKNQLISRCDKGIICDWCQCPIKDEWRDEAREQLRREGKI